ncbi:MAG TPA: MlaD family protein [Solirubrobacteraceae bacterium]|nr:MlaD family protein [Solirubrobacteraceae bacterium]
MKRAIREHWKDVASIVGLLLVTVFVAGYILDNERLSIPFISPSTYTLNADFQTAQAVTPGQGQSVRISGVQIGLITGVTLKNGEGVIQMSIDKKYEDLIRQNWTALIRPRTGLDDMFIELSPGIGNAPVAKSGYTIPVSNTMPVVNLDEILASLDEDSREYLDLLVNGAGQGLQKNGGDELAQVMERFEPTHQDLARLNGAVAQRGADLQQLVNSLRRLNDALAAKQGQIVQLVDSSEKVFGAFASEDSNVSRAVGDLPGTLEQTTATLAKVQAFANALGPAAVNLLPAVKAIPAANQALTALAVPGAPIVQKQIRPFVVAARPVVRNLRPAAINLADPTVVNTSNGPVHEAPATSNLSNVFTVLNHFGNMLGYNPGNTEHGYLWWLAWLDHNARTLFSVQDANGDFRPLFLQASCATYAQLANDSPLEEVIMNLTPILTDAGLCPTQAAADASAFQQYERKHPGTATASSNPSLSQVQALQPHASSSKGTVPKSSNLFLPKLPIN